MFLFFSSNNEQNIKTNQLSLNKPFNELDSTYDDFVYEYEPKIKVSTKGLDSLKKESSKKLNSSNAGI